MLRFCIAFVSCERSRVSTPPNASVWTNMRVRRLSRGCAPILSTSWSPFFSELLPPLPPFCGLYAGQEDEADQSERGKTREGGTKIESSPRRKKEERLRVLCLMGGGVGDRLRSLPETRRKLRMKKKSNAVVTPHPTHTHTQIRHTHTRLAHDKDVPCEISACLSRADRQSQTEREGAPCGGKTEEE